MLRKLWLSGWWFPGVLLLMASCYFVATSLDGCTSAAADLSNFNRNLLAAVCSNPSAAIANIPSLLSPAQAEQAIGGLCAATFGTVAAPTPAPGNQPALPAAAASPAKS